MSSKRAPRQIAILAYPDVQSLDVTGPLEVFHGARQLLESNAARGTQQQQQQQQQQRSYEVKVIAGTRAPLRTSSGLQLIPDASLDEAPKEIDTLIVAGGHGSRQASADRELVEWIAETSAKARRTASVCTGAFLLAAAGLLGGRRATTHWVAAGALQRAYPDVQVDPEPIFVRDGPVWTSAGVTAGMDLSLALVEEDLDRAAALEIARHLVLFLRRPGSQSQFSATLVSQQPEREPLREIQRAVLEQPAAEHTVEAMAQRAHMSQRHFARAFRAETGVTPARYVERVRLEVARRLLEDTAEPVAAVASTCGFGTAETMRRVFIRVLEVGPSEYRRRFHCTAQARAAAA